MVPTLPTTDTTFTSSIKKFLTKQLFVVAVLLFGLCQKVNAQTTSYNYNYSESAGNPYTDLTTGTVVASGSSITAIPYLTATLPFNFHFNGSAFTQVNISDNGHILMGNANIPAGNSLTSPISAANTYSGAISCFGNNLYGILATSEIKYDVIGSAPNRVFVVQYKDMQRRTATATLDGVINAQIRLYESTNLIECVYKDLFSSISPTSFTGQVGLRGATNTDFNNRSLPGGVYPTPTATTSGTASNGSLPTLGQASGVALQGWVAGTKFTWTPCFAPLHVVSPSFSGITATMQADNSTVDISWTNPSFLPTGGFDFEIRSDNAAPGTVGAFLTGNTGSYTAPVAGAPYLLSIPGLITGTIYHIFVKPNCKTVWMPYSLSSNVPITITSTATTGIYVTPTCPIATIPYTQTFEGVNTPAIPNCNSVIAPTGTPMVTQNNTSTPYYGFANKNLITTGANAQNSWYFTQAINFAAAGSYRVSYKYGGSREFPFFEQKMKVYYGATATVAGMTTLLADHSSIKASPLNNGINFTVSTPGVYYIGFYGYANATQGFLQIDDINVDITTCFAPTALISGQLTSSSAVISWTAPASAPSGGYQYYYSTLNATPINTTTISGSTPAGGVIANLYGLSSSTTYYFWVRSNCGGGDVSSWSTMGTFTTLAPVTGYCIPAPITVDGQGITNVTFGSINNTTGAEVGNYGDYTSLTTNVAQTTTVPVAITFNTSIFDYNTKIWVDWNNDGDFYDTGENVVTGLSASTSPNTLVLSFVVPTLDSGGVNTLGPHRMRIGGADIDTLTGTGAGQGPCYNGNWGTFEDYSVYVIAPPPALTLSSNAQTICEADATTTITVTSNQASFQVYTWSPTTGVTGTLAGGYNFAPTQTTTYILTATQSSGNFSSNTVKFTVTVNPLPTVITVTPSSAIICQNATTGQLLQATGGIISGVDVSGGVCQDFNSGIGLYTSTNTSTGGSVGPAAATWTLRPSPYTTPGTFATTISSNDTSQFFLSNSDAQGSGGNTNTTLISPVFSLAGYTSASLSFWHYYRDLGGDANVDISNDGGLTWVVTPLANYNANQGTPTAFVNVTLNLSAYVGQTNLKIRFRYNNAPYAWWWAIDNVRVFGSATTAITWSPTAGLYTNVGCTTAYTGGASSSVYAKPNATTTYTASADSPEGCTRYTDVVVTVTPISGGTANSNQTICFGSPNNLTLTGYTGTITGWQSANNAAFTLGLVNIPASASATLTSAQMGAVTADKYYRAVVTNVGGCTSYSTVVTITFNATTWDGSTWSTGLPSVTKTAIFDNDYTSTGDLNACSVLISSGDVLFNSNHNLIVQNTVDTSGGTLTFNNNASLVQQVAVANAAGIYNGGNIGNIIYNRTTPAPGVRLYDYTYWSSPVNPQTLVALSPATLFDKYFFFNTTINNWQSIASSNLMIPGTGYIIRAPQSYNPTTPALFSGSFSGVPNNGTISTNITVGPGTINLIGNPYPSAINIDLFLSDLGNDPKIGGTIYLWTHNTPITGNNYVFADYATYNYTGGVGTGNAAPGANTSVPSGKVAAGQSFMIEGSIPASTNTVVFKNSMRVIGNNNQFYRSTSNNNTANESPFALLEKNRIWLELFNADGAYKQTLVGYIQNATNNYEEGYDGKLIDVGNTVNLYSIIPNEKLAIQGRALPFDNTDIVPLGYRSNVTGNFTIKLSDFDGFFTDTNVYLEDLLLNVIHDLKQSDYNFTTNAGTFDSRFQLRYTNGVLSTNNPIFNDNSVVVFKNATNEIVINSSNTIMKEIKVFDIRGRQLFVKDGVNANEFKITNLNSSEQVLIVAITSEDGKIINKKIIF